MAYIDTIDLGIAKEDELKKLSTMLLVVKHFFLTIRLESIFDLLCDLILYNVCLMDFVKESGKFDHMHKRLVVPCCYSFDKQLRFFHKFIQKN